jgi:hypothetical protein
MDQIDRVVGSKSQIIAAVADSAFGFAEQNALIQSIVAVTVTQTIESLGVVRIHKQTIKRVQQSSAFKQVVVDRLQYNLLAARFRQGHSQ